MILMMTNVIAVTVMNILVVMIIMLMKIAALNT